MKKGSLLNEKNLKVVFILSGVFFLVYGILLCIFSNINTGVVLVGLIGVFLLCLGAFYNKIKELTSYGIFKKIKIFVIVLMIFEMSLILFIAFFGYSDNARYNEEAVIVLGAGIRGDKVTYPLKVRLDKAIEYHKKNPEALIVLSGGQGFQETVTEAYAMEHFC